MFPYHMSQFKNLKKNIPSWPIPVLFTTAHTHPHTHTHRGTHTQAHKLKQSFMNQNSLLLPMNKEQIIKLNSKDNCITIQVQFRNIIPK